MAAMSDLLADLYPCPDIHARKGGFTLEAGLASAREHELGPTTVPFKS